MGKVSVDDLKRIKEETAAEIALRQVPETVRVTVHIGDCGLAAGARDVMKTFMKVLEESGRRDIRLLAADCPDPENCGNEPKVTVQAGNTDSVIYENVTPEKAEKIFSAHVLGGNPL
ncbi:MAG: (2Fe-2S) ferredoxin domain-containing protein [Desulfosalsimonadaceae bacterium]